MRKQKNKLQRVFGENPSFFKVLAVNFLLLFIGWPFLVNVAALIGFYMVLYPLSFIFGYNPNQFFDIMFLLTYWPWSVPILSVPLVLIFTTAHYFKKRFKRS